MGPNGSEDGDLTRAVTVQNKQIRYKTKHILYIIQKLRVMCLPLAGDISGCSAATADKASILGK